MLALLGGEDLREELMDRATPMRKNAVFDFEVYWLLCVFENGYT